MCAGRAAVLTEQPFNDHGRLRGAPQPLEAKTETAVVALVGGTGGVSSANGGGTSMQGPQRFQERSKSWGLRGGFFLQQSGLLPSFVFRHRPCLAHGCCDGLLRYTTPSRHESVQASVFHSHGDLLVLCLCVCVSVQVCLFELQPVFLGRGTNTKREQWLSRFCTKVEVDDTRDFR